MKLGNLKKLSYDDLASYTDNFSQRNYLCHFQFGKLYHGKIVRAETVQQQYVMVKVWEKPTIYEYMPGDNELRLMDEVILHRNEMVTSHPGMLKMYGYCFEGEHNLGVVYEFKPFDSLFNLVRNDSFTWLQRIKVALGFASLLRFLHSAECSIYEPFKIRNLDCAHVVLDGDYNPKLCDFGLITGGIFPDRTIYTCHHISGSYGYIDIYSDPVKDNQDVFGFGAILLSMISKRLYTEEDREILGPPVPQWALKEFAVYKYGDVLDDVFGDNNDDVVDDNDDDVIDDNDDDDDDDVDDDVDDDDDDDDDDDLKKPKFSLVHQSLAADPDFDASDGYKITKLGLDCSNVSKRPNMEKVLTYLLERNVVKKHVDFLGVDKLLSSFEKGV